MLIDLTVTMLYGKTVTTFTAKPSSLVNGATTNYQLAFTTPIPLANNYLITFNFPAEIELPTSTNLACTSSGNLVTNQVCTVNGQVI